MKKFSLNFSIFFLYNKIKKGFFMHHDHLWLYSTIIITLIVLAKLISKKTSTVDVLWLIVFGSICVNLGFLPEEHKILESIGEWGIVFIMFALGFDENLNHFMQGLKRTLGIATIGAIFPFTAGFYTAQFFGFDFNSSMIWGLTMTATAVSLTMVSLRQEKLSKSTAATAIMTAAVIDDVLSLVGLSILIPVILSASGVDSNSVDIFTIGLILLKVVFFFITILFIGLILFPEKTPHTNKDGFLTSIISFIRHKINISKLINVDEGNFTPVILVFIAFSFGTIAEFYGFHPAIGAYFGGLFLTNEYFKYQNGIDVIEHKEKAQEIIDHMAFTIFGPIFFVMLGTKLIFDLSIISQVILPIFVLFSIVLVFQILSAAFAARFTGKYAWNDSIMIGLGMLGRAELAFIVINIAYTQHQIINLEQFYILIGTLFLLNITVPTVIKLWKPYYTGEKELILFGVKLSK